MPTVGQKVAVSLRRNLDRSVFGLEVRERRVPVAIDQRALQVIEAVGKAYRFDRRAVALRLGPHADAESLLAGDVADLGRQIDGAARPQIAPNLLDVRTRAHRKALPPRARRGRRSSKPARCPPAPASAGPRKSRWPNCGCPGGPGRSSCRRAFPACRKRWPANRETCRSGANIGSGPPGDAGAAPDPVHRATSANRSSLGRGDRASGRPRGSSPAWRRSGPRPIECPRPWPRTSPSAAENGRLTTAARCTGRLPL